MHLSCRQAVLLFDALFRWIHLFPVCFPSRMYAYMPVCCLWFSAVSLLRPILLYSCIYNQRKIFKPNLSSVPLFAFWRAWRRAGLLKMMETEVIQRRRNGWCYWGKMLGGKRMFLESKPWRALQPCARIRSYEGTAWLAQPYSVSLYAIRRGDKGFIFLCSF